MTGEDHAEVVENPKQYGNSKSMIKRILYTLKFP